MRLSGYGLRRHNKRKVIV
ncbi:hypothetical protein Goshw_024049 [Gossypium schwendimanii]|uniref:Uncharacterized protein n=1 Tax=Gossypium schwendimanii TaxID=34291 RepID=A0A7J9MUY6_GOSSC|nr:hypothetical protein [Gossypium schwendimanii]